MKCIYLFVFSVCFCLGTAAQVNIFQEICENKQDIMFDTSGKMIAYPSTFVTAQTSFRFQVKTNRNVYYPWIALLKQYVKETKKYLSLDEVKNAYDCLFETDQAFVDFKNAVDAILLLPDSCNGNYVLSKIDSAVNEWIPVKQLIQNVGKQYLVRVFKNNICIDSIWLDTNEGCAKGCNTFSSTYRKLKQDNCEACVASASEQYRFQLVHINPWNKTVRDWYTEKSIAFVNDYASDFPTIVKGIDSVGSPTVIQGDFSYALTEIANLRPWFLNWFWFNGGRLAVDPFNILTQAGQQGLASDIAGKDREITVLKKKVIFLDSSMNALAKNIGNLNLLDTLLLQQSAFNKQIESLTNEKNSLQKMLKGDPLRATIGSNAIKYEGVVQPSKSLFAFKNRSINPHKQFDAFLNYAPIKQNYFQQRKTTEVPENEKVYIAIHNIPQTLKVKLDEKSLPFNDQEEFTALVSDLLSKIDFSALADGQIRNLEDFTKSLGVPGGAKTILKGTAQDESECYANLRPFLKRFSQQIKKGYATFPPDTTIFDNIATAGPLFRTQLAPITTFEPPYRDSITIKAIFPNDSTVEAAKTYVKVGKLRFMQLAAGIAINRNPASVTKIDTSGNGFRVSSSENAARAIFGLKIYPFKNYNRDHSIIPRYPLRRLSVLGAFDMLKPLDNFYIGGAYDIVPGLAFSAGTNYYLETRYAIENNTITNTSRRYKSSGTYYSIVVNPVLFVQFVKLFFKKI